MNIYFRSSASEVLMIYFAKIGRSEIENIVELDFIETLLDAGADINYEDAHGQTLMHEVTIFATIEMKKIKTFYARMAVGTTGAAGPRKAKKFQEGLPKFTLIFLIASVF